MSAERAGKKPKWGPEAPLNWRDSEKLEGSRTAEQRLAAASFMREVMGFRSPQKIEVWKLKDGTVVLRVLPELTDLETLGPALGTVEHRGNRARVT